MSVYELKLFAPSFHTTTFRGGHSFVDTLYGMRTLIFHHFFCWKEASFIGHVVHYFEVCLHFPVKILITYILTGCIVYISDFLRSCETNQPKNARKSTESKETSLHCSIDSFYICADFSYIKLPSDEKWSFSILRDKLSEK